MRNILYVVLAGRVTVMWALNAKMCMSWTDEFAKFLKNRKSLDAKSRHRKKKKKKKKKKKDSVVLVSGNGSTDNLILLF